jgi:hypothetical protein
VVRPELAGIGAAPQIFAKAASLFSRLMFCPAVTRSWPALWVPTPKSWTVRGAPDCLELEPLAGAPRLLHDPLAMQKVEGSSPFIRF